MTVLMQAINISVDLPVLNVKARSLRRFVMSATTGGRVMQSSNEKVVVRALSGVSFSVAEGDRIGLVGHNGSGKSTLLRTLARIYKPTSGHLLVQGRTSAALDLWTGLDGEATGEENILSLGLYRGRTRREVMAALPAIADFSELGSFLGMPVKAYSAGMVARLAFSVATSFDPEILLMDEWITAVDSDFLSKAQDRLHSYFSKARAVVIATHDRGIIDRLCNRVIVLQNGSIVEVLDQPAAAA